MKDVILNIIAEVSAQLLLKGLKSYSKVYYSESLNKLMFIVDKNEYCSDKFLEMYNFISYLEFDKYNNFSISIYFMSNSKNIDYTLLYDDGFILIP